jgi:hypothetical protein
MADGNLYLYPGLANARARMDEYREKAKALAARARDPLTEAMYVGEVVGSGYLVSRLSGMAGPDGRTLFGIPVELLIGGALGGAALVLVGRADTARPEASSKNEAIAEHLLALGSGAIGAYTARLGFQAGLANAKPPEESQGGANQVSGAPAPPMICYLPAPSQWLLPATTTAPTQVPAALPAPAATAGVLSQEYMPPLVAQESTSIGADEIETAVEILDRMNRR